MIKGKSILAIIPARGGSKGVPRKNIRQIAGKPLIAWTICEAKKSRYVDRVILSSEDQEIISIAVRYGCEAPFTRPADLARDETSGIEPVLHALKSIPEKYDYAMLLQPTSPLRTASDIDGCVEKCMHTSAPSCVSLFESGKDLYWSYLLDTKGFLKPLIPESAISSRQNLPKVHTLNGAIYIAQTDWLKREKSFITNETVGYVMPKERSIDIDEPWQFELCEDLLKMRDEIK